MTFVYYITLANIYSTMIFQTTILKCKSKPVLYLSRLKKKIKILIILWSRVISIRKKVIISVDIEFDLIFNNLITF